MHVLVAPGSFGAALPAVEAAAAIAAGWSRRAPADTLTLAPLSNGGAGFVDVLHASLGGEPVAVAVPDGYGAPTPASVLVSGGTAYVESSQAFTTRRPASGADAERASSLGVGLLVGAALRTGAARVVVGVAAEGARDASGARGEFADAPNDGGAGLLAGLGATSAPPGALTGGAAELAGLTAVDLTPVAAAVGGAALVLATDDETPLLGLLGTTNAAGTARGIEGRRVPAVDANLQRLAGLAGPSGHRLALTKGAGAGGGVGYALLVAGGVRAPGLATVADEIRLGTLLARADLVVTGELALDGGNSGRLSSAVATRAGAAARPCIALAGRVGIGARESRALGIESAYGVADGPQGATGDPAVGLAVLAERVARTWSWSR